MIDPALFSIRSWLQQTFYDAVLSTYPNLEPGAASESRMLKSSRRLHIDPFSVPVNRLKDSKNLCYVSAIAFKLANLVKNSPLELAQRLIALLSDADAPIRISALAESSTIWRHTHVTLMDSGWIYVQIGDRGLVEWLTLLTNPLLDSGDRPTIIRKTQDRLPGFAGYNSELFQKSNNLLEIQYIHARCCSLLKLGDRERLIHLNSVHNAASSPSPDHELNHNDIHIVDPTPLPWLNADRTLRFDHPAERALMIRLIATWDSLHDCSLSHPPSQPKVYMKLAHQLSQEFQTFYQTCRMFGDETTNDLSRVQARLGITLATQRVLRVILENRLGVSAPAAL
ncbi:MAG TPA: DALR anticodon-binding domain-containing protein [Elainellaceae cyanobacterium]